MFEKEKSKQAKLQEDIKAGKVPASSIIRNDKELLKMWKMGKRKDADKLFLNAAGFADALERICNAIERAEDSAKSTAIWNDYSN